MNTFSLTKFRFYENIIGRKPPKYVRIFISFIINIWTHYTEYPVSKYCLQLGMH